MKTTTHSPFIKQVTTYLRKCEGDIKESLIVFPTQLSIDYFTQVLLQETWSLLPTCCTLRAFMVEHSAMRQVSTLALLQKLYACMEDVLEQRIDFKDFYPFGMTLLQDFNELDHCLVDAATVFLSLPQPVMLAGCKLSGEQLLLLYKTFTESLLQEGHGYEGLCCRVAAANPPPATMAREVIFVGFNLLTPAEEQFILQCKTVLPVVFFWDGDRYYLENELNIAGYYLRKYRQNSVFQEHFPQSTATYFHDGKEVVVDVVHHTMAQIQTVIETLQLRDGKAKLLPAQTAIALGSNRLLVPLLDKLANVDIPLHCRLNYPFHATAIYTIIEKLATIWEQYTDCNAIQELYHALTKVFVLLYPFVTAALREEMAQIAQYMQQPTVSAAVELALFAVWLPYGKGFLVYIREVLGYMAPYCTDKANVSSDLFRGALRYMLMVIEECITLDKAVVTPSSFLHYGREITIPYCQYNPLTGLYIVEVADSANLDFEYVFFIDMQEGCCPTFAPYLSYIPYSLRSCTGLPLPDRVIESITAYGFYRLLQRTSYSYATYVKQDEMSRFLLQLILDSPLKVVQQTYAMDFVTKPISNIVVNKDKHVMQLLGRWVGDTLPVRFLTSSALVSYLRCSLQFYFTYLLQLRSTTPKEEAPSMQVGIWLHAVMERLYRPWVGRQVDATTVGHLKANIKKAIVESVPCHEGGDGMPHAFLLIAVVSKFVERLLELDKRHAPFDLLGVEVGKQRAMAVPFSLDAKRKVWLNGIIDRVDKQKDTIRIVDYKTGYAYNKWTSVTDLFNRARIKKNKAVFQLFLYSWLFKHFYGVNLQQPIMPYLIQVQELFTTAYTPGILVQQTTKQYRPIEDIAPYMKYFSIELEILLLEIFDPAIPFKQTEDWETCKLCPYVDICQRN